MIRVYDKNYIFSNYRPEAFNFIKKDTLAQMFSCEFCEISKNTFFHRISPVAASVRVLSKMLFVCGVSVPGNFSELCIGQNLLCFYPVETLIAVQGVSPVVSGVTPIKHQN